MKDTDCVRFLQWALPRLGMRWPGFRKVRGGVCKRIERRIRALHLRDIRAYQLHLEASPAEWDALEALCRVPISRFFRDRGLFDRLRGEILPRLAGRALAGGEEEIRAWSCGCASGEEPYSLALLWRLALRESYPALSLRVTATDADPHLLERARAARYRPSGLKELPGGWRELAFEPDGDHFRLKEAFRAGVSFLEQDIRREAPAGRFHLILCRNLAFTYFDEESQREVLKRLRASLLPDGELLIGAHEELPE